MLRIEGWGVNHKRVERIWRQEGLKVPERQPKRGRLWLNDGSCIRLRPLYRGRPRGHEVVRPDVSALRALSAQYEQAQQQHAAQVETLQQQVEALERQVAQFGGQMTRLARDYRTLAETLRGRWS